MLALAACPEQTTLGRMLGGRTWNPNPSRIMTSCECSSRTTRRARQGCPICQLVTESVARYLDDLIFFSAVKPDTRAEIRAARGFCNEHASQLAQLTGKGLGVALIHEDIIDTVMEGLAQACRRPTRGQGSRFAARSPESLPADLVRDGHRPKRSMCWRRRDRAWPASTSSWSKRAISARSGAISTMRRSQPLCAPRPDCACPICARRSQAHPMRTRCGG